MKNFSLVEGFIPSFVGRVGQCRRLYDDLIIFRRDGRVVGCRTVNDIVRGLKSFYDITEGDDAALISSECISFDCKWIYANTKIGCAAVFTDLYAASGLLIALIFHFPAEAVRTYYGAVKPSFAVASPSFDLLPCGVVSDKVFSQIDRGVAIADSALSHRFITAATHRLGAEFGEFLANRIMEIADLVGCVGNIKSEFGQIPRLEALCPEMLICASLCLILFARNSSSDRCFDALIGEHKGHITVSFSIAVDKNYKLYDKQIFAEQLIAVCEDAALSHGTFFDCSLDGGKLKVVFAPESDPMTSRRIKQDFEGYINGFWDE